jgi:S1-C subfamily serine protease
MSNTLIDLSNEVAALVAGTEKSVVAIYGGGRVPSSGVHWKAGFIVTAEHSLRRDDDLKILLPDGRTVSAELAGRDPGSDVAVLKFEAGNLPVIQTGGEAQTGDLVVAVGRHREIGTCAALGIVSVAGPGWNTWRGGRVDRFLRLDISLYPGSTGAAVVNARGEAIGIATSVFSRIAPVAIPATTVDRVSADLINRGRVARGYLGVGLQPVPLPQELGSAGMIVLSVEPDSPASKGGLVIGDILVELNGHAIKDTRDVQAFLSSEHVGKTLPAAIIRGGKRSSVSITIGEK